MPTEFLDIYHTRVAFLLIFHVEAFGGGGCWGLRGASLPENSPSMSSGGDGRYRTFIICWIVLECLECLEMLEYLECLEILSFLCVFIVLHVLKFGMFGILGIFRMF